MRKWQVKKDGKSYFGTDYDECMYPLETMKHLVKAGFKIYKEGKVYTPKEIEKTTSKKKG